MISGGTVAFHTLGCKLNFSETSTIAKQLGEAGFAKVSIDESPDVVVVNTCSVTDHADAKCRNIVRRSLNSNPLAYIVVIGCYAQLKPAEIAGIEGVDLVLGANEKFNLPTLLNDVSKRQDDEEGEIDGGYRGAEKETGRKRQGGRCREKHRHARGDEEARATAARGGRRW